MVPCATTRSVQIMRSACLPDRPDLSIAISFVKE
jgi:hypothetical protein